MCDLLPIEDYNTISNGNYNIYIDHLKQCFDFDFLNCGVTFNEKKVLSGFNNAMHNEKFDHITTKESSTTAQRELDIKRCERIKWIKMILEDDRLFAKYKKYIWKKNHKKNNGDTEYRTYVFLPHLRVMIVLSNTIKGDYLLITFYYVEYDYKIKEYIDEYNRYK